MAHPILSLWLLVSGLGLHACGQGAPDQENHPTAVTPPASSTFLNNSHFAFRLYRHMVAPNPSRNVLFSPLSFTIPLTLLALKANADVHTQVLQGLGFSPTRVPDNQAHVHYSQLLRGLLPPAGECRTDTGSILFVGQKQIVLPKFADLAQNLYLTEVSFACFKNFQMARDQMDHFTRKKTHGKIGTLVQDLKADTVLILANYMFFKGKWKYRFDPKLTELRPFSLSQELTILVPTMLWLGWFQLQRFYHLHSYALWLPFICNSTAVFILPDMGKVRETEEGLMNENFDTWTQPFPLRHLRSIQSPRRHLGNFSTNHAHEGLPGAEEEDVTNLWSFPMSLIPAIHFNRPFLLLVFEESSHNLLFMGKVMNPNAKS
ncbi:PREDICTED: alpha-1-antitrypsin [Galeopterus variegatus]|uniref:Alpha-1-antitrypsin n=1 Tax=Galeopterus variegatus TaxID=482537 RepID=A0ABM0RRC3_GALVR|nr:PREDICTED: alpha-1-antitrypsin [Galeopterus variegatus]